MPASSTAGALPAPPRGIPLLLSLAFVAAAAVAVGGFFQDDGYIAFRYAENLAAHATSYYNPGEDGPYGYSNPGYVLLLAGLRLLSFGTLSFEVMARGLALLSLAAVVFGTLAVFHLGASAPSCRSPPWRSSPWGASPTCCPTSSAASRPRSSRPSSSCSSAPSSPLPAGSAGSSPA